MYGFRVKKDSEGWYYEMLCAHKQVFYIHRFSFASKLDAMVAAFDHTLLRSNYHRIYGTPEHFFNGRG